MKLVTASASFLLLSNAILSNTVTARLLQGGDDSADEQEEEAPPSEESSDGYWLSVSGTGGPPDSTVGTSESTGFNYGFNMSGPDVITSIFPDAGIAHFLDPTKISNNTMSLAQLWLYPGAVRELHWHPQAAEWGFVTDGTCRITLMNNDNQYENLEVGVGDIWFFPESWGHAIQGVDEEVGCKMVLFFNDPSLPTYNDLSISEILSAFPSDAVSENTNTPVDTVNTFYQGAIIVNKGYMPPGPFPESTNPLPESPVINILDGPCSSFGDGGHIYEIKNEQFSASKTMSGGLIHLEPGTLRDMHWHPNADEMHYVLSGSLKVSVYGIGGASDTFILQKGDVGFVPKGFAHYFESLDEATEILLAFNNPSWNTQELSSWLAVTPSYLTAISLNVSTEAIAGFPTSEELFIGDDGFDGCPATPTLPLCYGCDQAK